MKRDVRVAPAGQVYGYVHESWDNREDEDAQSPDVMQYDAPANDDYGDGDDERARADAPMRSDRDIAVCFLRDAGFESDELEGTWDELAAYVRGRLRGSMRNGVANRTRSQSRARN